MTTWEEAIIVANRKPTKESEPVMDDLAEYLGETVIVWCDNYVYHGTLTDIGSKTLTLEDTYVVFSTGYLSGVAKYKRAVKVDGVDTPQLYDESEKLGASKIKLFQNKCELITKAWMKPK